MRASTQDRSFLVCEIGGDSASMLGCHNQLLTAARVASPSVVIVLK